MSAPGPGCRIFPGGVSHRAARLRVDGWPHAGQPPISLASGGAASGGARVTAAEARRTPGSLETPGWMVDLEGLEPDTLYTASLALPGGGGSRARFRTAPARLAGSDGLLLGLASCYFPAEQYAGNGGRIPLCFQARVPHLTFHVGDQIYADVSGALLGRRGRRFESRYRAAWSDGRLGKALSLGGHLFAPDDHEYWNGFPEPMPWLPATWAGFWKRAARVAREALWVHQGVWNLLPGSGGPPRPGDLEAPPAGPVPASWAQVRLGEVEVFVTDSRSDRSGRKGRRRPGKLGAQGRGVGRRGDDPSLFDPHQHRALLDWLEGLGSPGSLGLLCLSQPLLARGNRFDGVLGDYPEHREILAALERSVLAGGTVVLLTGDIHYGRLTSWRPQGAGPGRLVELVASPVARIGSGWRKVSSLLSRRFRVGKPKRPPRSTKVMEERYQEMRKRYRKEHAADLLPGLRPTFHFATGENQLGVVEIREPAAGRRKGTFRLYKLDGDPHRVSPAVARNAWGSPGTCSVQLAL